MCKLPALPGESWRSVGPVSDLFGQGSQRERLVFGLREKGLISNLMMLADFIGSRHSELSD